MPPAVKEKPKLPYCTPAELDRLKKLEQTDGLMSVRTGVCIRCGEIVPENKLWCSEPCCNAIPRRRWKHAPAR